MTKRTSTQAELLNPVAKYLALEVGALNKKIEEMQRQHMECVNKMWAVRLQDDQRIDELNEQIQELQEQLNDANQQIETDNQLLTTANQKLLHQHFKMKKYEQQWREDSLRIIRLTRQNNYYRELSRSTGGETAGETTEEE